LHKKFIYFLKLNGLKHETVIIPSTSQPLWGSYFVFEFKAKALSIINIAIQFNVSALNCIVGKPQDIQPLIICSN